MPLCRSATIKRNCFSEKKSFFLNSPFFLLFRLHSLASPRPSPKPLFIMTRQTIPFAIISGFGISLMSILSFTAEAQYRGVRFNLRVQKDIELKNDQEISFQQQLQITPDFIKGGFIETDDPDFQEIDFIDPIFLPDDDDWDEEENDDWEENEDDDWDEGDDGNWDDEEEESKDDWDDEENTELPKNRPTDEPVIDEGQREPNRVELGLRSATSVAHRLPLSKNFDIINGYTYFIRPNRTNTHRIHTDLLYGRRIFERRFTYSSRFRLQHSVGEIKRDIRVSSYARLNSQLRLRGKVSPFVRAEILYRVRLQRRDSEFNRVRAAVGTDFRISSRHRIRCIYDFQRRFNRSNPENSSVLSFEYRFRFADSRVDRWDED